MKFLDIFFPKRCVGCGKIGNYFCSQCRLKIRNVDPNEAVCPVCERLALDGYTHPRCKGKFTPDGLTSFFRYDGVIKKAIKSIKYRYVSDLAWEFVSLTPGLSLIPLTTNHERLTLIPIPLHISRFKFRGFNQAEKLGEQIADRLKIPVRSDILCRTINTTPQVNMRHKNERLENMERAFSLFPSSVVPRESAVLLFDDVFTTGATIRAATNVLKRAGVSFVWAVTIAR